MALSTYTELKASILEFLERTGDGKVTPQLDTIIPLAEAWINRKLGGYQRESSVTALADSNGLIALPTGFAGVKAVTLNRRPYEHAVSGSSLSIANSSGKTFDIVWMLKLAPLNAGNPTNWLLVAAPDAYLDACLMRASILLQDVDGAAAYGNNAATAINELTMQNLAAQYGSQRFRMPVQVP